MKLQKVIAFFLFLVLSAATVAQGVYIPKSNVVEERDGKSYYVHTVTKGQTVYSIAKTYNVTIDEVYYENPEARNGLQIGQKLWIPTVNKETEVTNERATADFDYFYHITSDNETFSKIAKLYNIPERYIRLANPGLTEPLKHGEYVKIPIEASFPILDGKVKKGNYGQSLLETKKSTSRQTTTSAHKPTSGNSISFNPNVKVMENYRHVVIKGETLQDIAKKYQITVKDLKLVNPGLTSVYVGERLRLPDYAKIPGVNKYGTVQKKTETEEKGPEIIDNTYKKKQVKKESKYFKYTVKKGDNIFKLSKRFGVSLDDIYDANPSLYSGKLKAGSKILIPKLKKRPEFVFYKVPYKTKLKKVAVLFGISKDVIKKDNPELSNKLLPGQVVRIRAGEEAVLFSGPEKKESTYTEPVIKPTSGKKKKCIPSPDKNRTYKIALMVPLFLEEMADLDTTDFLNRYQSAFKPFWFLKFLEGAFIAADSLKNQGYNIEYYVYDVDDQVTKAIKTLQRPELRTMDMIIGPFYSKSFDQVAIFAANYAIPVVNPFTFRDEMLMKYDNIIKVKPGASSQVPLLKKVVENYYKDYKVFVISHNAYKDADIVNQIKTGVNEVIPGEIKISNIRINNLAVEVMSREENEESEAPVSFSLEGKSINPVEISENMFDSTVFYNNITYVNYMIDSIHPLENTASPIRKNLVILFGQNKSFLMDALNRLNVLRDTFDIEVIGMPYWEQIKRPDYQIFNNLHLTYFSSFYINYDDERVHEFVGRFHEMYKTEPDDYAFAGFDITLFFVKSLADYGKKFKMCLPQLSAMMFENGFSFRQTVLNKDNFENTMWNILKIEDFQTKRLPESDMIPVPAPEE
jgi:LysM repeat protein